MAPAVKRLLPPASSSGARSNTSTDTPCSRADSAAHRAALPPPTTTTSAEAGSISVELRFLLRAQPYTRRAVEFQKSGHVVTALLRCDPCMVAARSGGGPAGKDVRGCNVETRGLLPQRAFKPSTADT